MEAARFFLWITPLGSGGRQGPEGPLASLASPHFLVGTLNGEPGRRLNPGSPHLPLNEAPGYAAFGCEAPRPKAEG